MPIKVIRKCDASPASQAASAEDRAPTNEYDQSRTPLLQNHGSYLYILQWSYRCPRHAATVAGVEMRVQHFTVGTERAAAVHDIALHRAALGHF